MSGYVLARNRFLTHMRPIVPTESVPRVLIVDNQARDFLEHRMALACRLREAGFEVHVAVPREPKSKEISRQGIPVHPVPMDRKGARLWDELHSLFSLVFLYRRLRPTLVHHVCLKPTLYGGLAARINRIPVVVSTLTGLGYLFTTRTVKARVLRSLVESGLRFSTSQGNHHVIFQNPDDRDRLLADGAVSAARSILIRGSGVNVSVFRPEREPQGVPVVLMASRMLWEKGVGEFVAAATELRHRGIRARFLLIGEPDFGHPSAIPTATLERWCESGAVEWLGWREDMPSLLAQSHIVCLPSYYGEGVPRILLEAAAAGRPIVTTDSPGCREVVHHRINGLLVPARDREALVRAIVELIENPSLRSVMGARGREIAVAEFSLEQVIEANLKVWFSLLAPISSTRQSSPLSSS